MAQRPAIEIVEAFHLTFLRVFERKYDRAKYVVKGGVNVRAWFGSLRYSEDMDIDAIAGQPHSLEAAVDKVLVGRDFVLLLEQLDIAIAKVAKSKMTDTTQRWKLDLKTKESAVLVKTKIEFSWREDGTEPYTLEPVRGELARAYGIPAPSANHYAAAAAIRQKIRALAKRREPQARDVWDLEHLFRQPSSDPRPLSRELLDLLPTCEDRIWQITFDDFAGQVLAYLAPEDQSVYGTAEEWDRIRTAVLEHLRELAT